MIFGPEHPLKSKKEKKRKPPMAPLLVYKLYKPGD
jgi:hypothetical protein